jgi:2,3-bisphosphoglycerate-independent phosphoglycerate mutase
MEYDGDLHIPSKYLVTPPSINETISEYIVHTGLKQFAVSETQKFGHVTYFWNGNRSGKFDESMEEYLEIPSDKLEFNQRPWMQAAQITDAVIEALNSNKFDFIRLNYPNGDMVGHTGDLEAAIIAAETVDLCLRRLLPVIKHHGAIAVITADHGNLEEMYEVNKKTGAPEVDKETGHFKNKTSHTLNPVPVTIYDPDYKGEYELSKVENPGLANIAATLLMMLDLEVPENYEPSLIKWK